MKKVNISESAKQVSVSDAALHLKAMVKNSKRGLHALAYHHALAHNLTCLDGKELSSRFMGYLKRQAQATAQKSKAMA